MSDLDKAVANITSRIIALNSQHKLQHTFPDTLHAFLEVGKVWRRDGKEGIPLTYKVIEGLASLPTDDLLVEYLSAITKKQKQKDKDDENNNVSFYAGIKDQGIELQEFNLRKYFTENVNAQEFETAEVRDIVATWVDNNIFEGICSNEMALEIVTAQLEAEEEFYESRKSMVKHQIIMYLYKTGDYDGLTKRLRELVTDVLHPKLEIEETSYVTQIKKVVFIVNSAIKDGQFSDIAKELKIDDELEFHVQAIHYLNEKEEQWNFQADKFGEGKMLLPPIHRTILTLHDAGDTETLLLHLRQLIRDSHANFSIGKVQNRLQKIQDEVNNGGKPEKVLSAFGTTMTVALSTLHTLIPAASESAFKTLIGHLGVALLNPALSSFGVIAGFSGAVVTGICIYNAYCVWRGNKNVRLACKNVIDAVIPMAIASGIGIAAALSLATITAPVFATVATFAGVGFFVHLVITPLVSRFSQWLLYDLPESEKLRKAYKTLNISDSATDQEVRSAYRKCIRRNHPDMHARTEPTPEEAEKQAKQFFEIQTAFEYILAARLKTDYNRNPDEGFLARIKRFFTSGWSGNQPNLAPELSELAGDDTTTK